MVIKIDLRIIKTNRRPKRASPLKKTGAKRNDYIADKC